MIKVKATHYGAIITVEGDEPDRVFTQLSGAMRAIEETLEERDEVGLDEVEPCEGQGSPDDVETPPSLAHFRSHKVVEAAKIVGLYVIENGQAELELYVDHDIFTLVTRPGWTQRFTGSSNDLGYYVVYPDGHTSWSPTRAFEEGYQRID